MRFGHFLFEAYAVFRCFFRATVLFLELGGTLILTLTALPSPRATHNNFIETEFMHGKYFSLQCHGMGHNLGGRMDGRLPKISVMPDSVTQPINSHVQSARLLRNVCSSMSNECFGSQLRSGIAKSRLSSFAKACDMEMAARSELEQSIVWTINISVSTDHA